MDNPAAQHKATAKKVFFQQVKIGETFECNGNLWTKKSHRTAAGIWPAILPAWAYFKQGEVVCK